MVRKRKKRMLGVKPVPEREEIIGEIGRGVSEALKKSLGEGGMRAVLFHLRSTRSLSSPKAFHQGLYAIFGEGALILEKTIVREILRRQNVAYEEKGKFEFEAHLRKWWSPPATGQ